MNTCTVWSFAQRFFDTDVNLLQATVFNPYFTLGDWLKWSYDAPKYGEVIQTFIVDFALADRTVYEMPFYVLESDGDEYNIGHCQEHYFDRITAPDKEFRYISGTHISTMLHSEELASFVHEIALKQKTAEHSQATEPQTAPKAITSELFFCVFTRKY